MFVAVCDIISLVLRKKLWGKKKITLGVGGAIACPQSQSRIWTTTEIEIGHFI